MRAHHALAFVWAKRARVDAILYELAHKRVGRELRPGGVNQVRLAAPGHPARDLECFQIVVVFGHIQHAGAPRAIPRKLVRGRHGREWREWGMIGRRSARRTWWGGWGWRSKSEVVVLEGCLRAERGRLNLSSWAQQGGEGGPGRTAKMWATAHSGSAMQSFLQRTSKGVEEVSASEVAAESRECVCNTYPGLT